MLNNEHYPMQKKTGSENTGIICGAKTRTGAACKNKPVVGKKRCRMHGGTSRSGKDHWNYKHGYWTKEEKKQRSGMMRLLRAYMNDMLAF